MSFIYYLKERGKRTTEKEWGQLFNTITLQASRRPLWVFGELKVPDCTSSGLKIVKMICSWLSFFLSTVLTPAKSVVYC